MEEQEKQKDIEIERKQRYKFMDCRLCGSDRRFISTVSPGGHWVCCQCRTKVSGKPFKLEMNKRGCVIKK